MLRRFGSLRLLLAATLLMAALPAMGVQLTGNVHWQLASGGWVNVPVGTYVKLCYNDGTAASASGQGASGNCIQTRTVADTVTPDSPYGSYWVLYPQANRSYWIFTWNDNKDWGSETSVARFANGGSLVYVGSYAHLDVYSTPRPRKPVAVYPVNNARMTPLSFTLKWSNGLDSDRASSAWPVTYDIYANGAGAAESLILSNIPCNPDSSGYCSYPITNLVPTALYYWRVEAKLNPGLSTPGNPYYKNSSDRFTFAAQGTTYSLKSDNGSFVGADGCGNSTVSAKVSAMDWCQRMTFYDVNGGALESGDQIWINTYASPYNFTATYGGGSTLYATSQWGGWYETFTITKTEGGGVLQSGDAVTLQAYYGQYCSAAGGGGGRVDCSKSEAGPWEIFTLGILP